MTMVFGGGPWVRVAYLAYALYAVIGFLLWRQTWRIIAAVGVAIGWVVQRLRSSPTASPQTGEDSAPTAHAADPKAWRARRQLLPRARTSG